MSDRIFGGIGLMLSLLYIWRATLIPDSFMSDAVGPRAFPYGIAAVMALASIWFLIKPDPEPEWPRLGRLAEIGFAALVMIAYAQLLPELGFVISTAFAAAYLTWRLGSSPLQSVLIGVGTSLGIYAIFHLVLGLSLARGPLGF
ncbi:MAG: tripartite tricarboxylate transporter TctB family protein [Limimaricola soesokkakensis]|jgi:putative tricarboxylic transport membrane protein|uniref:Tricarboxylic transport membrane protein n=1 Tax=Limimaricola variabilis TaxID=1492771 RepID=A0ABR6HPF9_9RHOB|nr:tripartite tricarboxylate transporter TctB family protein [Limimaricola variabilis]MBB3712362.1 putative tricarboxylic transport membrane protein [Limimaricola variabilis]WPY94195.1 tripartite tricarboxylate transporter TctB family protein [Limimaricola variabilis]